MTVSKFALPVAAFVVLLAAGPTAFAQAPAKVTPKAPAAATAPKMGKYHCVFFINGSLQTVPGFTLTGSRYTHQNGGGGTTKVVNGNVEFTGGPLTGQAAKIDGKVLRIFNERRSRTVIDCDNKG